MCTYKKSYIWPFWPCVSYAHFPLFWTTPIILNFGNVYRRKLTIAEATMEADQTVTSKLPFLQPHIWEHVF